MQSVITIHQKNLETNKEEVLCDSVCDYIETEKGFCFEYHEQKPYCGKVKVSGNANSCILTRFSEHKTTLYFEKDRISEGVIETPYGEMKLQIKTKHYIKKEGILAIEYELYNDEIILEHYRLMMKIKKVV